MSRTSLISSRRSRAACRRPATGTRLLPIPFPDAVSPSHPVDPLRVSPKTSAPSRPTPHRTVGSRGIAPRKISRSAPLGAEAGLRGIAPRKISRSAPPGVEAGLRGIAPRKISCSAPLGAEAGPRGIAPRKISCSAPPGAEAGPRGIAPRVFSHVPSRAAEGVLATLILSPSLSRSLRAAVPSPSRRVALSHRRPVASVQSHAPHQPKPRTPEKSFPNPFRRHSIKTATNSIILQSSPINLQSLSIDLNQLTINLQSSPINACRAGHPPMYNPDLVGGPRPCENTH